MTSTREPPLWQATLDGRYDCRVDRIGPYEGNLKVRDLSDGGKELLKQRVSLMYGAQFGPDVSDVAEWQDRCTAVIDVP